MISKIKKIVTGMTIALALVGAPVALSLATSGQAYAVDINDCLKTGSNLSLSTECDSTATDTADVSDVATTVINIISVVVGVIAVVMIIFGGAKYITSGGESSKITGAKNTIIYALIGLVVVALAQVIVHFVLNKTSTITS